MTEKDFDEMAAAIARLNGVDKETAAAWLAKIGDVPEFSEDEPDKVVLPDGTGRKILWPDD